MSLPPSDKNLQLGMFMSCMRYSTSTHHTHCSLQLLCSIVSASGAVAAERCVSAVLEHRSALATLAGDLVLLPLSLLGLSTAANTVNKKIVYFRCQLNQDCLNIF